MTESQSHIHNEILTEDRESLEGAHFKTEYRNRNVVLDPANQKTHFYNLQAEATLSSLDSNVDTFISKDQYLHEVSLQNRTDQISKRENVAIAQFGLPKDTPNDGMEGDDEYEEDIEEQNNKRIRQMDNDLKEKSLDPLRLDLNLSEGPINTTGVSTNEIIFSPGGNEALVFVPSSSYISDMEGKAYSSSKVVSNPEHDQDKNLIMPQALDSNKAQQFLKPSGKNDPNVETPDDTILMERPPNYLLTRPRGERPTTVGQSAESPKISRLLKSKTSQHDSFSTQNRSPRLSPRKNEREDHFKQKYEHRDKSIQRRMEDNRISLLTAQASTTDDTDHLFSAEPSPRLQPGFPREQLFHQHPDNVTAYHDITTSHSERDEDDPSGIMVSLFQKHKILS